MMASLAGQARLFKDNFYGDGAKAYDFGYPRIQANVDDPFPDPAYNSTSGSAGDTVYAGNMTYAGCYTDGNVRTLATLIYDSTPTHCEKCTTACANAGYSIAGMEYGSQCWCDNKIGPYTQKALDLGCSRLALVTPLRLAVSLVVCRSTPTVRLFKLLLPRTLKSWATTTTLGATMNRPAAVLSQRLHIPTART